MNESPILTQASPWDIQMILYMLVFPYFQLKRYYLTSSYSTTDIAPRIHDSAYHSVRNQYPSQAPTLYNLKREAALSDSDPNSTLDSSLMAAD